ncbi:MAG: hypothetical protein C4543_01890 [Ignavibacteriales bacterium]|nr:MAG: hypothetical protein C4543_01890 [Ignavibacteriales bacterium]
MNRISRKKMYNILEITKQTIREAFARKIFIMFAGVSTLVLVLFIITFAAVGLEDLSGSIQMDTGKDLEVLEEVVGGIKLFIVIPLFGGGLFLSIFSASSFIPNMLEKGNIDVILSKPISRSQIIFGKFLGGTLVVLLNIAYLVIGIWFLIGLKFGIWHLSFLLTIVTITFAFAVLYSLIILIGILSQSSILAMMLSYIIFFILSPILSIRDQIMMLADSKVLEIILEGLYYIVPKTSELGSITSDIAVGGSIYDFQPIFTSAVFLILSIALSIIIFSKKDY